MLKQLTSENLDRVARDEKGIYLIKFTSTTCAPCRTMAPVVESFKQHNPQIGVYEVDTGASPELAAHFQIRGVPTILFCRGREILYSFSGVRSEADLHYMATHMDDPYFKEHGEFEVKPAKQSWWFAGSIIGIVIFFVLLYIFAS
ncbi:MAG: hypothetical protein A2504_15030 [Bdellovibrionales bacterium RIFOXYD12_FULL_39_22]|nr:MAG: hypothetical protein A2385_02460 [Bdellovibrionales bacterium RIFOXYB1_FULL_39_21]OFZ43109.1 MAG: hypothetical protein A2485_11605 [Bdellovibrionales bacterium RIFOXYC12_FULL_39_17]OFZ47847.1 MAG: hypothetical protein A2404_16245 [Bdellovibrionales bacterium RIFOXYC1_FULL_39_130]OFZ75627.1 MAG: hypothetical protein A2560_12745 [Bdellovibrionales bacterium RIFOXYD1_FULL_39_84]OFZ94117.1 MAG: hypothetical protein A2504_15030 [Bdellovibrionales bacterium RIFOXYD12_FULL_39_22]HLE11818.1 th